MFGWLFAKDNELEKLKDEVAALRHEANKAQLRFEIADLKASIASRNNLAAIMESNTVRKAA